MFQSFLGRTRYYHFVKPAASKVPVNVSLSNSQNECELGNCLDGEFRLSEQSFLAPFSTIDGVNVTSEHSNMLSPRLEILCQMICSNQRVLFEIPPKQHVEMNFGDISS